VFALVIILLIVVDAFTTLKHGEIYFRLWEDFLPLNKIKWYYDREFLDTYRTGKEIRLFKQDRIINDSYNKTMFRQ
jgi:hypothetical protein